METIDKINKLLLTGSLMADLLRVTANELDVSSGVNPERLERKLPETWENYMEELRSEKQKYTG